MARDYDPMLQIMVPIGLIDDLVGLHVEPGKGEEKEAVCRHCSAEKIMEEVRLAASMGAEEMQKMAQVQLAQLN